MENLFPSPRPDRFISQRDSMDVEFCNHLLTKGTQSPATKTSTPPAYKQVASSFKNAGENKILSLKHKAPAPKDSFIHSDRVLFSYSHKPSKPQRYIATQPSITLEAPGIENDFYMNLLDWSSQNILGIGLQNEVFLWNGDTSSISILKCCNGTSKVASVKFADGGAHLAVGTDQNTIQIWDIEKETLCRTMKTHKARVCALSWNKYVLSSGSKDCSVMNNDVRVQNHLLSVWDHHSSEVCGLKWNPKGCQLASGANDNLLNIWDARFIGQNTKQPLLALTSHQAAVKAISWAPFQSNLLASGGGTGDRCLRFWNTQTGAELCSVDTGSQVCSIQWATNSSKELITSHGFAKNQLIVWRYPSLTKMCDNMMAHTQRVLHTALSPDGTTVASAAGDEKLCFWQAFEPKKGEIPKEKKTTVQRALR